MTPEDESAIPAFKKRKLVRACDYCRRKKSKHNFSLAPKPRELRLKLSIQSNVGREYRRSETMLTP